MKIEYNGCGNNKHFLESCNHWEMLNYCKDKKNKYK